MNEHRSGTSPSVAALKQMPLGDPQPRNAGAEASHAFNERMKRDGHTVFKARLRPEDRELLRGAVELGLVPTSRAAHALAFKLLREYLTMDTEAHLARRRMMAWWGIESEQEATSLALRWLDGYVRGNNLNRIDVPDVPEPPRMPVRRPTV